jgi:uncharacterized protein YdaU (DUF1376 family)
VIYYERHLGDYLRETVHLSLLEHGVYTRLLDVYHQREAPIPDAQSARLVGARTQEERDALAQVLREFFRRDGEVWRHVGADVQIERYHKFLDQQRAKGKASAAARFSNRQATAVQPEGNNGSTAADPRFNRGSTEHPTAGEPQGNRTPNRRSTEHPTAGQPEGNLPTSLHPHLPTSQLPNLPTNPLPEGEGASRPPARAEPVERDRGKAKPSTRLPDDFDLTPERAAYAAQQGVDPVRTFQKFRDHWLSAAGANARKVDWDAAWRKWCAMESERVGPANPYLKSKYDRTREHLERLIAAEERGGDRDRSDTGALSLPSDGDPFAFPQFDDDPPDVARVIEHKP